jgi:hypothetical protein
VEAGLCARSIGALADRPQQQRVRLGTDSCSGSGSMRHVVLLGLAQE